MPDSNKYLQTRAFHGRQQKCVHASAAKIYLAGLPDSISFDNSRIRSYFDDKERIQHRGGRKVQNISILWYIHGCIPADTGVVPVSAAVFYRVYAGNLSAARICCKR